MARRIRILDPYEGVPDDEPAGAPDPDDFDGPDGPPGWWDDPDPWSADPYGYSPM